MKNVILYFTFIFISLSQSSLLATNPISVLTYNEMHYSTDETGSLSLWSKAKTWIAKKSLKIAKKTSLKNLSTIALLLGILSLALVLVFFASGIYPFIFIAYLGALIGGILSLIVLQKTKKDKSSFKEARRIARYSLIFNVLTWVAPLIIFMSLVLIS